MIDTLLAIAVAGIGLFIAASIASARRHSRAADEITRELEGRKVVRLPVRLRSLTPAPGIRTYYPVPPVHRIRVARLPLTAVVFLAGDPLTPVLVPGSFAQLRPAGGARA